MSNPIDQEIRILRAIFWSERDPEGRAFVPLADAYLRRGSPDEAVSLLEDGLARHPSFSAGHLVAARAYRAMGDPDRASAALASALSLDPGNASALRMKGELAEKAGDRRLAVAAFREAYAQNPSFEDLPGRVERLEAGFPLVEGASVPTDPSGPADDAASADEGDILPITGHLGSGTSEGPAFHLDVDLPDLSVAEAGGAGEGAGEGAGAGETLDASEHQADTGDASFALEPRPVADTHTPGTAEGGESEAPSVAEFELEAFAIEPSGPAADAIERPGADMGTENDSFQEVPAPEAGQGDAEELTERALEATWDAEGWESVEGVVEGGEAEDAPIAPAPEAPGDLEDFDAAAFGLESFPTDDPSAFPLPGAEPLEDGEVLDLSAEDEGLLPPLGDSPALPPESEGLPLGDEPPPHPRDDDLVVPDDAFTAPEPPEGLPPRERLSDDLAAHEALAAAASDDPVVEDDPLPVTRTLGELYARQGLLPEAVSVFRRLLERHPEDASLLARLAELEGASGDAPTEVPTPDDPSSGRETPVNEASDVEVAEIQVPGFEAPEIEVPDIEAPEIRMPDMEVPAVGASDVEVSETQAIEVPDIGVPEMQAPDIEVAPPQAAEEGEGEVEEAVEEAVRLDDADGEHAAGAQEGAPPQAAELATPARLAARPVADYFQDLLSWTEGAVSVEALAPGSSDPAPGAVPVHALAPGSVTPAPHGVPAPGAPGSVGGAPGPSSGSGALVSPDSTAPDPVAPEAPAAGPAEASPPTSDDGPVPAASPAPPAGPPSPPSGPREAPAGGVPGTAPPPAPAPFVPAPAPSPPAPATPRTPEPSKGLDDFQEWLRSLNR